MSEYPDDTFLARWLDQRLTPEEQAAFEQSEDYPRLKVILEATDQLMPPEFERQQLLEAVKRQRQEASAQVVSMSRPRWRWMAAAILLICGIMAWWWLRDASALPAPQVLLAAHTEQVQKRLPDGTFVQLNAGSELQYRVATADQPRFLGLQGEAFLTVSKGADFVVETETGSVRVLGTAFRVNAREGLLQVTCYEGTVWVQAEGLSDTLSAGQEVVWRQGIHQSTTSENTQPTWLAGVSSFQDAPLREVIAEFERQYDVTIQALNIDLDRRVTASFKHGDLKLALETAFIPIGLVAEIRGRGEILLRKP